MSTEAEQHSKALQKLIKEDYEKEKKVTKLLLLGTGECPSDFFSLMYSPHGIRIDLNCFI